MMSTRPSGLAAGPLLPLILGIAAKFRIAMVFACVKRRILVSLLQLSWDLVRHTLEQDPASWTEAGCGFRDKKGPSESNEHNCGK
jgi:hypothetical protein